MIYNVIYSQLTSTYKLGNPNTKFYIWRRKIEFIFSELNIKYVLTDPKPTEPTDDSSEEEKNLFQKWLMDDQRCRNMMLATAEHQVFFTSISTAKDMMESMRKITVFPSTTWRMLRFDDYMGYKMPEGTKVMDHVFKMDSMVRDLEQLGMKVPQEMQVAVLMTSLPDSWGNTVNMILVNEDAENDRLNMDKLIKLLRNEQEYRDFKSLGKGNQKATTMKKGKCFTCGEPGHHRNVCLQNVI